MYRTIQHAHRKVSTLIKYDFVILQSESVEARHVCECLAGMCVFYVAVPDLISSHYSEVNGMLS